MYLRKTKVICTLGPAVDNDEMLRSLIRSGMDCARFNFSHGTHESHLAMLQKLRHARDILGARWPPFWTPRAPKSASSPSPTAPSP